MSWPWKLFKLWCGEEDSREDNPALAEQYVTKPHYNLGTGLVYIVFITIPCYSFYWSLLHSSKDLECVVFLPPLVLLIYTCSSVVWPLRRQYYSLVSLTSEFDNTKVLNCLYYLLEHLQSGTFLLCQVAVVCSIVLHSEIIIKIPLVFFYATYCETVLIILTCNFRQNCILNVVFCFVCFL